MILIGSIEVLLILSYWASFVKGIKPSKKRTGAFGMAYPGLTVYLVTLSLDRSLKQMMLKKLHCTNTQLHMIPVEFYNLKQSHFRSTQDITKDQSGLMKASRLPVYPGPGLQVSAIHLILQENQVSIKFKVPLGSCLGLRLDCFGRMNHHQPEWDRCNFMSECHILASNICYHH